MKLAIVGSSHPGYLADDPGLQNFLTRPWGTIVESRFLPWSGATFARFNSSPEVISSFVQGFEPDIILVILGGNSIVEGIDIEELKDQMVEFYTTLRFLVPIRTKIIYGDIFMRYKEPGNRHNSLPTLPYYHMATGLNKWVRKSARMGHLYDYICHLEPLGLPIYLCKEDYVHLNDFGIAKCAEIIRETLDYIECNPSGAYFLEN